MTPQPTVRTPARPRARRARLRFDVLEDRTNPDAHWTGGAGGSWSDKNNWLYELVPGQYDLA